MNLRKTIMIASCTALIVVGSYVAIPVGPVPITLQTLFILLAGILAGKEIGFLSVALYLVLGAIGLPLFQGGVGGFAHFAGPTGGFLISWLPAASIAGYFSDRAFRTLDKEEQPTKRQLLFIIAGTTLGTLTTFVIGIPYLKMVLNISWQQAFLVGFFPFIVGDLMKLVSTVILGNIFAVQVRKFLGEKEGNEQESSTTS